MAQDACKVQNDKNAQIYEIKHQDKMAAINLS